MMNNSTPTTFLEITLGHSSGQQWAGQEGPNPAQLLYVEKTKRHFWIWLPENMRPEDNSAAVPRVKLPPLRLGDLNTTNTIGRLVCLQPNEAVLSAIENSTSTLDLYSTGPSTKLSAELDLSQTLADYLKGGNQDLEVVRQIAWYASSQMSTTSVERIANIMETNTFNNLTRNHPAYTFRNVSRDPKLVEELRQAVDTRGIVFINGGSKTGLSEFLEQFKGIKTSVVTHLPADFDQAIFRQILDILRANDALKKQLERRGGNCETVGLLISLAHVAYVRLLESPGVKVESLADLIHPDAVRDPSSFVIQYTNDLVHHRPERNAFDSLQSQIEPFLAFLSKMIEAAGYHDTLTIVLSFPKLMNWIREKQGEETAVHINRFLWTELGTFANANLDAKTGKPIPNSVIAKYAGRVGLLIETRWLAIPEMNEGFCRHCVLTMPPFSRQELTALWKLRTGGEATEEILEIIKDNVGGIPWFTDLLLDCFQLTLPTKSTVQRLRTAIELAANVIKTPESDGPLDELKDLKGEWDLYSQDLKTRLPQEALTYTKALLDLTHAAKRQIQMPTGPYVSPWFESGLVWLRHEQGAHTLRALESYPFINTYQVPALVHLFIKALRESEVTS
jgi:hypothetical protein